MITRLAGAATLFSAGAILLTGTPSFAATPLAGHGSSPSISMAGSCSGGQDAKKDDSAAKKDASAKKDGSCGKDGSCSKDHKSGKKAAKDGSCSKDKKTAKDGADAADKK